MRALVVALGLSLVLTLTARADSSDDGDAAASEDAALEDTLRAALAAYQAGDLDGARSLFERVHSERPSARTLRGLGVVASRQERFVDAVVLLEQSLTSTVKPLNEAMAQGVRALLASANERVSRLELQVTPMDAVVRIDGDSVPSDTSGALLLAPGPHALEVSRDGYASAALSVTLGQGERQHLAVVLTREPEPPPASVAVAAARPQVTAVQKPARPAAPAVVRDVRGRRLRRAGYVLLSAAAAALVTSIVATSLGALRVSSIEDECRSKSEGKCTLDEAKRAERRENLSLLSALSLTGAALAGTAGASGTTLLLFARRRASDGSSRGHALGIAVQHAFW